MASKAAKRKPTARNSRGPRDTTRAIELLDSAIYVTSAEPVDPSALTNSPGYFLTATTWDHLRRLLAMMDARTGRRDPSARAKRLPPPARKAKAKKRATTARRR